MMLPWFPGDFMRSTRGWSVTAKGVYRELLDAQWDMGQLPATPAELQALISATAAEWKAAWPKCEPKFPIYEDGCRRNPRLEAHRSKSSDLTERRQRGAAKTNAQRHAQRTLSDTESVPLSASVSARSASRPAHASDPIRSDPSKNTHTHSGTAVHPRAGPLQRNSAKSANENRVCVDEDFDLQEREDAARG